MIEESKRIANNLSALENSKKETNLSYLENEKKKLEKSIFSQKNNISKCKDQENSQRMLSEDLDIEIETLSKRLTEIITEIKTLNQLTGSKDLPKETILSLIKIKSGYENTVYASLMYELDATLKKSRKRWIKKHSRLKAY